MLVFAAGFAVRVGLILAHPAIHGGDSVARLARSDTLLLAYQLPLPQALVYVVRGLAPDPLWTRLVFAAAGALAGAAVGDLVRILAGPRAGIAAGLLLLVHPLFVYYSVVPYQESLTVAFLALAGAAALRGRHGWTIVFLGLSCLCRYEAWIAALLAAVADRRRPRRALLHLWAPLLWIAAWGGLSPRGTYVLDLDPDAARLSRLVFLFGKLREYTGDVVLALAACGAVWVVRRRDPRWAWGAAVVVLVLLAVVLVGHEYPPGSGIVSERAAHLPAAAVCILAGVALAWLPGRMGALVTGAVLAAVALHWTARADRLLAAAGEDPSLRLALAVARAANGRLAHGERLGVVAPPVPAAALDDYVRKVAAMGGDAVRARQVADSLADRSPDADRVAAHLARPPGTVVTRGPATPALVVVFDDASVPSPWTLGQEMHREQAGPRGVTLYRIHTGP